MTPLVACALASVLVQVGAIRHQRSSQKPTSGIVDLLYTYGAPSVAKPGLTNFSGCFQGMRTLTTSKGDDGTRKYDLVGVIARAIGYENARQAYQSVDIVTNVVKSYPCSPETSKLPNGGAKGEYGEITLHWKHVYAAAIAGSTLSAFDKAMGFFGEVTAFEKDQTVAKRGVESQGWKLAASAWHEGGREVGGSQVNHLIQHPETLDCVLTFQGSQDDKDWKANAVVSPAPFCGRKEKVHKGIAYAVKLATRSDDYVRDIKPKLPMCARVIAAGQSQGAGQAELFTACVNQRKKPRCNVDYKRMAWNKGTPSQLPYV